MLKENHFTLMWNDYCILLPVQLISISQFSKMIFTLFFLLALGKFYFWYGKNWEILRLGMRPIISSTYIRRKNHWLYISCCEFWAYTLITVSYSWSVNCLDLFTYSWCILSYILSSLISAARYGRLAGVFWDPKSSPGCWGPTSTREIHSTVYVTD